MWLQRLHWLVALSRLEQRKSKSQWKLLLWRQLSFQRIPWWSELLLLLKSFLSMFGLRIKLASKS
ncbi:MAG: hypothetical protein CVT79_08570 [Alphaproteobacteria bacterium HGW-Alphaproteobacteria-18]|nr:MAG: hypothetical protein CVT79_08570 [Alphaproteobacteria bacterium HGW-Alphaproteobacteria-18]